MLVAMGCMGCDPNANDPGPDPIGDNSRRWVELMRDSGVVLGVIDRIQPVQISVSDGGRCDCSDRLLIHFSVEETRVDAVEAGAILRFVQVNKLYTAGDRYAISAIRLAADIGLVESGSELPTTDLLLEGTLSANPDSFGDEVWELAAAEEPRSIANFRSISVTNYFDGLDGNPDCVCTQPGLGI